MQKVSVIIAAWNAQDTIKRCLDSLFIQKNVDIEVVVIDDCSTDQTLEVLSAIQVTNQNLIVKTTASNSGPSIARNLGLSIASGEWIAIVDADDEVLEDRFDLMIKYSKTKNLDICFDNLRLKDAVSELESSTSERHLIDAKTQQQMPEFWDIPFYASYNCPYVSRVLIGFLKPLIKRSFIEENQLRYGSELRNSEDYIMTLNALIKGARISYLAAANYQYYIYPSSLSGKFDSKAHYSLISAEQTILSSYENQLDSRDIQAIKSHIKAIELASVTNHLFSLLKCKHYSSFLSLLVSQKTDLFTHLNRVFKSAIRKILKISNRGY